MGASYPTLVLNQALEDTVQLGHPWLYAKSFYEHDTLRSGSVVDVLGRMGDFVGRGVFDPDSPIRVRIWTTNADKAVNNQLLEDRIRAALKRKPWPDGQTNGFRLLNGEGDRTPGLVCDVYANVAVFRVDGIAAERWLGPADRIVRKMLGIEHVAVRRSEIYRRGNPAAEWLSGGVDEVQFLEHGLTFVCDPIKGQKTGFFLDQRANRQRIAEVSRGRRLCNLFGYSGGFSVVAGAQGAARTTTVDLAKPALADARRNFELNGMPAQAHEFEAADVFDYLRQYDEGSAPFDVIVCDPPSFSHKREDWGRAKKAYIRLFAQTMRVMPSKSRVALASCSSHIDRSRFMELVAESAREAGVSMVLMGLWGADVDHSVLPHFPEGDYLQFVMGTIHRD